MAPHYGQQVSCDAYLFPRSHIGKTTATISPAKAKPVAINIGRSLLRPKLGRTG
jgi:hypothetical protein